MNKIAKFFMTGGILVAAGAVAYAAAWAMGSMVIGVGINREGFHVYTSQTGKDQPLTYQEESLALDAFSDIKADLSFCDISIETGDSYGISYRIADTYSLYSEVRDGKLIISQQSKQSEGSGLYTNSTGFYFSPFHGSGFGTNIQVGGLTEVPQGSLTVYVPENKEIGNLTARCDRGTLSLSGLTVEDLNLQSNFGALNLRQISGNRCRIHVESSPLELIDTRLADLNLKGRFSALSLSNLSITESCSVDTESGDLSLDHVTGPKLTVNGKFSSLDARNSAIEYINLDIESRDVYLDHVSFTDLTAKSRFGNFTLISDSDLSSYSKDLDTEFGTIRLFGEKIEAPYKAQPASSSKGKIYIRGESCDVTVSAS